MLTLLPCPAGGPFCERQNRQVVNASQYSAVPRKEDDPMRMRPGIIGDAVQAQQDMA